MKKKLSIAIILIIALSSFIVVSKNNSAEANQVDGIYIFTDCKPNSEFDYLGTEKLGLTFGSGQYKDVRDKLIKKIKKQFPTADGIIFHFEDGSTDKAEAIKFK